MTKLFPFLLAFACLSHTSAHADSCVALIKGEKGYEDKISTLIRLASLSYNASELAELKNEIYQIDTMCSYKVFIELLKKARSWEPYVFASALDVRNEDAANSFIELITKHAAKWQPATYRCASRINSAEKAKLFKQMLEKAAYLDFPATAYDVLTDINNEAQVEAFSLILQKKTSFNWQDAAFSAVRSMKPAKEQPNYRLRAFKALLDKVTQKDWPAAVYASLPSINSYFRYDHFIRKNELGIKTEISDRLDNPYAGDPFETFFDNEDLETLIKDHHIGSIEELLLFLPLWTKSNYTLLFYSRSQQEASFQKPRAIIYTPLGDFLASFNDPTMPGGNIFETIFVNKKTFEFEFREIVFKDGKAEFSKVNPSKCVACHHGRDLKPNWDEYPFWLGAYGMLHDEINAKTFLKPFHATQQDLNYTKAMLERIGGMNALENTFEEFKKFSKEKTKHARYKYLGPDWKEILKYPPYREEGQAPLGYKNGIFGTPNEFINELVGVWNIQRIFRKVKNAPSYEKEKMNLLHFLAGCESSPVETRKDIDNKFAKTEVMPSSRYEELFTRDLGVDYLKMTDLTFGRDLMLFNDNGFIGSDYRMAYLLAEDIKRSVPAIGKFIKVENHDDERHRRMNSVAPKLQMVNDKWEGCAALEDAMRKGH